MKRRLKLRKPKACKNPDSLLWKALAEFEALFLFDALNRRDWNKTKTAKELGISYRSLYGKIKRFNVTPARSPKAAA